MLREGLQSMHGITKLGDTVCVALWNLLYRFWVSCIRDSLLASPRSISLLARNAYTDHQIVGLNLRPRTPLVVALVPYASSLRLSRPTQLDTWVLGLVIN